MAKTLAGMGYVPECEEIATAEKHCLAMSPGSVYLY
jgi:hypothetical protein